MGTDWHSHFNAPEHAERKSDDISLKGRHVFQKSSYNESHFFLGQRRIKGILVKGAYCIAKLHQESLDLLIQFFKYNYNVIMS